MPAIFRWLCMLLLLPSLAAAEIADADGDGIPDDTEGFAVDSDGDGTFDYLDIDSDNNGILDSVEASVLPPPDTDGDGTPDFQDPDNDGNGLPDTVEIGDPLAPTDTDTDGTPDHLDDNNDGDGLPDWLEIGPDPLSPWDVDDDGVVDYNDAQNTPLALALSRIISDPLPGTDTRFGEALAIDGDELLAGAPAGGADNHGRAYLFDLTDGSLENTFQSPQFGLSGDADFGVGVDLDGNRALISDNAYDEQVAGEPAGSGVEVGRAWLIATDTSTLLQTLAFPEATPTDSNRSTGFGDIVRLAGNNVVIASPRLDVTVNNGGSTSTLFNVGGVYLFDASAGTLRTSILNPRIPGTVLVTGFAKRVVLNGDALFLDDPFDNTVQTALPNEGRVFRYNAVTGVQELLVDNPQAAGNDLFGLADANSVTIYARDYVTPFSVFQILEIDSTSGAQTGTLSVDPDTSVEMRTVVAADDARLVVQNTRPAAASVESFSIVSPLTQSVLNTLPVPAQPEAVELGGDYLAASFGAPEIYIYQPDHDVDGLADVNESTSGDADGDQWPDYLDPDSDNNGINDGVEAVDPLAPVDTDTDGTPDHLDADNDGDGTADTIELGPDPANPLDENSNGTPDYLESGYVGGLADGDINEDGVTNAADLILLSRHLLNIETIPVAQQSNADLHPFGGDDELTTGDLLKLQQLLLLLQ